MPDARLARTRLVAQRLIDPLFARPVDAVAELGAMQGQDLPGVLASAALRTVGGDIADVLADLDAARLVRGYPMRGTVFLLPAADVVWTTQLCAAPTIRASRARDSRLGIEESHLALARDVALRLLGSGPVSRAELFLAWEGAGLATGGGVGYHLLFQLIAETTLVYGPWNGTDQDVAAVADWLPTAPGLEARFNGDRTAAVAELAVRYFTSHGPATVRDFAWWTKLTLTEIRAALPLVAERLESDDQPEASFWRPGLRDEVAAAGRRSARLLLLPGFDEFILGYQDRHFAVPPHLHQRLVPGNNGVFRRSIVAGGAVLGTWTRSGRAGGRAVELEEFEPLSQARRRQVEACFRSYPFVTP